MYLIKQKNPTNVAPLGGRIEDPITMRGVDKSIST